MEDLWFCGALRLSWAVSIAQDAEVDQKDH